MNCPVEVYQDEWELSRLLDFFRAVHPRSVLEVGSLYGGTLWHWLQNMLPNGLVVSVDQVISTADHRAADVYAARTKWQSWAAEREQELIAIEGDSTALEVVMKVHSYAPFEFIFIDGGHSYSTVSRDFSNYWPMLRPGGLMAFHDISYPDSTPDGIEVGKWWRDITATHQYETGEIQKRPEVWGIGIIHKRFEYKLKEKAL